MGSVGAGKLGAIGADKLGYSRCSDFALRVMHSLIESLHVAGIPDLGA
jgi:hypothetical protein